MKFVKGLSRLGFAVLLVLLCAILLILALTLETRPLVKAGSAAQIEEADSVVELLPQLRNAYLLSEHPQVLTVSAQQLDSLAGVLQRARPGLRSQVNLSNTVAMLAVSYELPFSGFYLNLHMDVNAGSGLVVGRLQLGKLQLPGNGMLWLLAKIVDWKLQAPIASEFMNRVQEVEISRQAVAVRVAAFSDLLQQMRELPPSELSEDEQQKRARVSYYLNYLQSQPAVAERTVSLHYYLQPLFAEVLRRSKDGIAAQENESALLALAIFSGNRHFARLVGLEALPRRGHTENIVLAGRTDLHLHFIYSAAIKLLSDQGVSIAIGEFKELMDRGEGGSGYSFVDLAADMASIRLAEAALDPDNAVIVQQRLAEADDAKVYFPQVLDLPEGMDKETFSRRFGVVDSPAYRQQVAIIEQRLQALPLYQP
ncbi:hypothetical protein [Lacimicrobium sp. SS2-24]|uniref:hypothetical protein n=1 Tax=Lacimicrobium sp. SS2-24 TaxID=2005569 RepID=UPI000B4BCCC1|nr:hypothetical protein [Lacimicrobium sp. SS2-24]